jgi:arylsulfatase A-like enzyme
LFVILRGVAPEEAAAVVSGDGRDATDERDDHMRFWGFLVLVTAAIAGADETPNIVLIVADDLGWSDVGYHGADLIETPSIDALATEGMQFSQAYAMPVCSPARAALLTGVHPARIPLTIWSEGSQRGPQRRRFLQAESSHDLPLEQVTLAEQLQSRGYLTVTIGKWHLGDASHFPESQGFDINIGGTHWGAPHTFFWPYRGSGRFGKELRYVPGLPFGHEGEYLTDRLTDEAVRIIKKARGRPFFLVLAHHAPHTPIEAKPADIDYFAKRVRPGMHHQNPTYAAMVKSLDESVGRVRAVIREEGLENNTVFIFTSDNGGYIGIDRQSGQTVPVTSNYPLRSGKGSCYEGGVRVPFCILWPGKTQSGQICTTPVSLLDVMPTCITALGLDGEKNLDGVSLTPVLDNPTALLERESLYFHYPHYYATTTPVSAVRHGRWKFLHYYEDDHCELYDLENDPQEHHNCVETEMTQVATLRKMLNDWRMETNAREPTLNQQYKAR